MARKFKKTVKNHARSPYSSLMYKKKAHKSNKLPFKKNKNSYIIRDNKTKGVKFILKKLKDKEPEFFSIINRVSMKPKIKLCDVTGLPAHYTCPKTKLNYFDEDVYYYIQDMNADTHKSILAIKNFGANLSIFK